MPAGCGAGSETLDQDAFAIIEDPPQLHFDERMRNSAEQSEGKRVHDAVFDCRASAKLSE
jgi:hypothetical protein